MTSFARLDWVGVFLANLFNLLLIGIMLARPFKKYRFANVLGLASSLIFVPMLFFAVYNFTQHRSLWFVVLPGLFGIFCFIELLWDYVLRFPFRKTRWLGPYLLCFYASQWGMIGFSFMYSKAAGFVTLITYFLSLAATAYSYKQVGHGQSFRPELGK